MIWKPHVTVAAVIEQQGRYLLVEENIDNRLVFNQPAGHLEEGESLPQAVTREVMEETAYHFEPQALVSIQLWQHPQKPAAFLRFTFCGRVIHHEPGRPLDKDIVATSWMTRKEIEGMQERLRSPLVWQSLIAYESGQRFSLDLLHSLT